MTSTQHISADFPFGSNYVDVRSSKIHYVDEGEGDPILFLHGNPTSSYLWRNIIPYLTSQGRCIAPDLIGMGKSDKPKIDYGFFDHVEYVEGFIERMDLAKITLVVHDWGSALGFHYAMRNEANVKGIAFMEAVLMPVPSWGMFPDDFQGIFKSFRTRDIGWDLIVNKNFFVEKILPGGIIRKLTQEEMDHYREPFSNPDSRRPVWRWPNELPIEGEPADVVEVVGAYNDWLRESDLPKLLFHARPGAIMPAPLVDWCRQNLRNLRTVGIGRGIHFFQEDNPHLMGSELASWYSGLS